MLIRFLESLSPSRPRKQPYLSYDSVNPGAIPAHRVTATYETGSYAVSPDQVAGRPVLRIDTTGFDPHASVPDVEPGDATPDLAAQWARNRLATNPKALASIYTMQSEWPAVRAAVATLPHRMQSHIRWWTPRAPRPTMHMTSGTKPCRLWRK